MSNPYSNSIEGVGKQKDFLSDFVTFLTKGNIIDIAIGGVLGSAFSKLVNSLSTDVLIPIAGSLIRMKSSEQAFYVWKAGKTESAKYNTAKEAESDGAVVIKYGNIVETSITFVTQAICMYFLIRIYQTAKGHIEKTFMSNSNGLQ